MTEDLEGIDPVALGEEVSAQVRQHLARHFYAFDRAGSFDVPPMRSFRLQVECLARFALGEVSDRQVARVALNRVLIVCYGSPIGDYPGDVPPLAELMVIFRCPSSRSAIGRVVKGAISRFGLMPPFAAGCNAFVTEVGTRCPRCDDASLEGCGARGGLRVLQ